MIKVMTVERVGAGCLEEASFAGNALLVSLLAVVQPVPVRIEASQQVKLTPVKHHYSGSCVYSIYLKLSEWAKKSGVLTANTA